VTYGGSDAHNATTGRLSWHSVNSGSYFIDTKEKVMFYKIFNSNRGFSISRLVAGLIGTIVANGSIIFTVVIITRYAARVDA
jgi:hypothetical protein